MRNGLSYKEAGKLGGIKASETIKKRREEEKERYYKNPVLCKQCGKPIPFEKRKDNKFCNRSCSAAFNNKGVRRYGDPKVTENKSKRVLELSYCLSCGQKIARSRKFCNNQCQADYGWKLRKEKIEKEGIEKSPKTARKYLKEVRGHKCEICGITEWMGQETPLVLDHINGNSEDNRIEENLRLICPNCDAQTDTYKSKNKGNGRAWRMKRFHEGKSY